MFFFVRRRLTPLSGLSMVACWHALKYDSDLLFTRGRVARVAVFAGDVVFVLVFDVVPYACVIPSPSGLKKWRALKMASL